MLLGLLQGWEMLPCFYRERKWSICCLSLSSGTQATTKVQSINAFTNINTKVQKIVPRDVYWKDINNQKEFFDGLAAEMGLKEVFGSILSEMAF